MENLEEILKKRILNFGPISISDFILEANLNSKFGYYNNHLPFGKKNDYVTSPEVSQMFGELIALWTIDYWKKIGEPEKFNIIELGPGSGILMTDFLRVIKLYPKFIKKCNQIYLFEISPFLKKIQKKTLLKIENKILQKIKWIKNLNDIPETPFVLIANEFFDALPIKQIQLTKIGWRERMLNYNKKKSFFISYSNNPTILEKFLPKKKKCKKIGSIYEIPFNMLSFLENLFNKIKKTKSTCLIVDYVKNKKFQSSLKSIKNQKIISPLKEIGNSDISTHVDFDLIKEISKKFNLNNYGPITQRKFLINLGILFRAKILIKNANSGQKKKIQNSLDFLINKKKMGEVFNVISISNKKIDNLVGF